jgi:hypothetical protein
MNRPESSFPSVNRGNDRDDVCQPVSPLEFTAFAAPNREATAGAGSPAHQSIPRDQWGGFRSLAKHTVWLTLWALMPSLAATPARATELLTSGIAGYVGRPETGKITYGAAMKQEAVQRLLLSIAHEGRSAAEIDRALEGASVTRDALEQLELIRRDGDRYVINFTLFTKEDVRHLHGLADRCGFSLAQAFLARRPEIDAILARYPVASVDKTSLAYILIGCFALDWDGLNVLGEEKYMADPRKRADGGRYTPWAEEKNDLTLRQLYWGSHNEEATEGLILTSFGDHYALPRLAFPDAREELTKAAKAAFTAKPDGQKLLAFDRFAQQTALRHVAQIMIALREGKTTLSTSATAAGLTEAEAKALLDVLAEFGYVTQAADGWQPVIPVLNEMDQAMTQAMSKLARAILKQWLAANYEDVRRASQHLSPLRAGVPFEEAFTQIWHYIFGGANRAMANAGLLADPYAETRVDKGFIPVVWSQATGVKFPYFIYSRPAEASPRRSADGKPTPPSSP